MLLSFTEQLTKILVTTGYYNNDKKVEIIDLIDPSNVCHPSVVADYPFQNMYAASGGLLNNNVALICGNHKAPLDECIAITDNMPLKAQ
jgi:hypothetical protein